MPFLMKINLDFRPKIIEIQLEMYEKHILKLVLIFLSIFPSPGGACRPGFARETERADPKSCDSHVLFEDYGVNTCSMLLIVA